jgi:hypothetical protein
MKSNAMRDSLETTLRGYKVRELPPDLKASVLAAARAELKPPRERWLDGISLLWRSCFYELRYGWGVLAAVWLVIAALQVSTPVDPAPRPLYARLTREQIEGVWERRVMVVMLSQGQDLPRVQSGPDFTFERRNEK